MRTSGRRPRRHQAGRSCAHLGQGRRHLQPDERPGRGSAGRTCRRRTRPGLGSPGRGAEASRRWRAAGGRSRALPRRGARRRVRRDRAGAAPLLPQARALFRRLRQLRNPRWMASTPSSPTSYPSGGQYASDASSPRPRSSSSRTAPKVGCGVSGAASASASSVETRARNPSNCLRRGGAQTRVRSSLAATRPAGGLSWARSRSTSCARGASSTRGRRPLGAWFEPPADVLVRVVVGDVKAADHRVDGDHLPLLHRRHGARKREQEQVRRL